MNWRHWVGVGLLLVGCRGFIGAGSADPESSAREATVPQEEIPTDMSIFLLVGQSNMVGVPAPSDEDRVENPRVFALGYADCPGRQYNEWFVAKAPLHRCGAGVGPGDSFGRAMAAAWPKANIGLVPAAIEGVDIDFFRKGVVSKRRREFRIPPDDSKDSAYDMVVERARLAQGFGRIRGILFHQGESNTGRREWVEQVAEVVADLRADLSLDESVPFVAGELLYSGCCANHNSLVRELERKVPNGHVVSADGLKGMDNFHFDLAGQRELGERYARAMLEALGS